MSEHPYIRYAQALLIFKSTSGKAHKSDNADEISIEDIIDEIENGLDTFRMEPTESIIGKDKIRYAFARIEKGNPSNGIFLSPNIISGDKQASNLWKTANNFIEEAKGCSSKKLNSLTDINMSEAPMSGEFLSFSEKGNIGRGKPKETLFTKGLSLITTLTSSKPCLQYRIEKKGKPEMFNVCIIPDLPLPKMVAFIDVFERMKLQKLGNDLFYGNVVAEKNKAGEITSYSPKRPLIFNGNFPAPPRSSAMGSIALLGAIGEFANRAEVDSEAMDVLESLKNTVLYMVQYGETRTFSYNCFVIDLAKQGKLKNIVDSIYYSKLYNQSLRSGASMEYQQFDLFTSRFLQLFTPASFRDFLSYRAEYPYQVESLFNTYFIKMESINPEIVASARQLGSWLNDVAFFTAIAGTGDKKQKKPEEIRELKSKVLVEIESSIFSAKTGDSLIAQVLTRAGRLSGMDAPEGATLFLEATASGELPLDKAKNLLIAFSRLRSKKGEKVSSDDILEDDDNAEESSSENE